MVWNSDKVLMHSDLLSLEVAPQAPLFAIK